MTVIAKRLVNVCLTIYHAFDVKQPSVPKEGQPISEFVFLLNLLTVHLKETMEDAYFCLLLCCCIFTHGLFVFIDKTHISEFKVEYIC